MITENYQAILEGIEIRQNLIELKKAIKEEENRLALRYYTGDKFPYFLELLQNADAKVRKNTALILGELGGEGVLEALWEAYVKEPQLFVKSSYLTAIRKINYVSLLPSLKSQLEELTSVEVKAESQKHVLEEISILQNMIIDLEQLKTRSFKDSKGAYELIMVTNSSYKDITKAKLTSTKHKDMSAGILIQTAHVEHLMKIRTFKELLFRIPGCLELPSDPAQLAKRLIDAGLVTFLTTAHQDNAPFYFRIELRSKMDLEKKARFTKAAARELEMASHRQLINSTSHYEFELRLMERQEGNYLVLLKLFTLKDKRFAYRKEFLPTSIHPVNAALVMELVKPYLTEGAQVLDPFCGVGTMLIERQKQMSANPLYGIDSFPEAIAKARINALAAGMVINFINRDFFDFEHNYQFDEVITNMPARTGKKNGEMIGEIYSKFFPKVTSLLKPQGVIIMYSNETQLIKRHLSDAADLKLEKDFIISEKDHMHVYVIRYQK